MFCRNAIVNRVHAMGEELNVFPSKMDASTQTQVIEMTPKSPERPPSPTPPPSLDAIEEGIEDPLADLEPIADTDLEEGELQTPNRSVAYRRLPFSDRPACSPRVNLAVDEEEEEEEEDGSIFNRRRRRNKRMLRKSMMEFKDDYVSLKNIGKATWIEGAWTFSF